MPKSDTKSKTATNNDEQKKNGKKMKTAKMQYQGKEIEVDLFSKYDFRGFDKETIIEWYKLNNLGRRLDDKAALYLKMAKGWSYHASFAGHDGIQLAVGKIFRQKKDFLFPYYRDLLTSLAAGITPVEIILNGLSKDTDVAGGGRHMSNHFAKPSINIQNVSSCTGNHSQHTTGLARAIKRYKDDAVSIYSAGESASSEGYFFEALNVASLEKLPAIFVLQNNKYGISVPLKDQTANENVGENFTGLKDLELFSCDGRDPFDSYRAMKKAVEYTTSGKGPAIVHADCDRVFSHSNSDRHTLYRDEEELTTVARRDPMMQFRYHLINKGILTIEEIEKIEEENKQLVFAAADEAEAAPDANGKSWKEFIIPDAYVTQENDSEKEPSAESKKISYLESINLTLKDEFRKNPDTYLWGQDIGKGGVFNVVKGMPEEFGKDRVFNAPIAEDNIVGTANGFTRYNDKLRVVVEGAEFADYFWPAMEQLVESSHDYWRTRGQFSPNVTMRLASGGYIQGGLYHSQNLEATFTTLPGIRVVSPAFADDAAGLLRNSIRSKGFTVFLEPKYLYNFKRAFANEMPNDHIIPFGKAKVRRKGADITIVSYGTAVHMSMMAAEDYELKGVSVEVIDLRSLQPWDKETVFESVKKTHRVLVAHEDRLHGGFGGEIVSEITAEVFDELDAPVLRVGSKNVPVGFAKSYEDEILLNKNDIKSAIDKILTY
jgi:2-oxoisovalerate dehydrogenase E1 component